MTRAPAVRRGSRLILPLALLLLAAAGSSTGESPAALQLDVTFKEQSFPLPGPVPVSVEFENRSPETVVINIAFGFLEQSMLDVQIVAPSGRTLRRGIVPQGNRPPGLVPRDFRKIPAEEKVGLEIDLAEWFELTEGGTYTVEVEYSSIYKGEQLGMGVWTGRMKSPARTLQLTK